MQYNKQHGSVAVGFAPCAVVEKPHEGGRVLKDKPCLAGRESVMRQENRVFHPFCPPTPTLPPFNFFFGPSFLEPSSPGSVFHQIPPLVPAQIRPQLLPPPPPFLSFWGILDLKLLLECPFKGEGGPGEVVAVGGGGSKGRPA